MKLKLESATSELDLSVKEYPTVYRPPSIKNRVKEIERYGKPGSEITGDRQVDGRTIQLEIEIAATSDTDYFERTDPLLSVLDFMNAPIYLVDTDNNRRCLIETKSISIRPREGNVMRSETWSIELIMTDAFWEGVDEIVEGTDTTPLENGQSVEVNNPGVVNAYPVIRLSVTEANTDLSLVNLTTGDLFRIGSSALIPGVELVIDSIEGTCYLDDGITQTEVSSAIADGSGFMYLAPGVNNIQYESLFGDVNIEIAFRRRYPL